MARPLQTEILSHGHYTIIRIVSNLDVLSDFSEVREAVEQQLAAGNTHIVISFKPDAYIYTHSIGVLIKCHTMCAERGGSLSIVAPNEDLMHSLTCIGLDTILELYFSEESLKTEPEG